MQGIKIHRIAKER